MVSKNRIALQQHELRLRPGLMKSIRELVVRMATDNSSWGYLRIQGEMKKVGRDIVSAFDQLTIETRTVLLA